MGKFITGYEGNRLCDFIYEEVEECPVCGGSGVVTFSECLALDLCPHGSDAEEVCVQFCKTEPVSCPECGGTGKMVTWR